MANNLVMRIDYRLANTLPRLTTLVLTNNSLAELGSLDPLGRFPLLEYLSLMGNPVARKQHYREYVVWKCKRLRVLDFQHVKQKERERARKLMETADGRPSALAVSLSASGAVHKEALENEAGAAARTFDVGSTHANGRPGAAGQRMTAEERKALEEAIEKSTSLEEIKRLEDRLRLGYSVGNGA